MRRTFWSLMLTGIAVTALAGFSSTTQEAEAGLFSRLRAHFPGNCGGCAGEVVSSCCPAPVYEPAPTCCPAPVRPAARLRATRAASRAAGRLR